MQGVTYQGLIGEGSAQVNSQLVPEYPFDGIDPLIFGGTYSGPAAYPQQGVFTRPPVPPAISDYSGQATYQSGGSGAPMSGGSPVAAMGGLVNAPTAADAGGNVMSFTKGPVLMAIVFLAISLLGLQFIHWRK